MASARYVALLRGINVGGRNKLPMADLRAAVEADGHREVSTYIASGNVLLTTDVPKAQLEGRLEGALERRFGIPILVVARSDRQMRSIVRSAPEGFGEPGYHCDVVFLKEPLTAKGAMGVVQTKEGVDRAWPGKGVVYFARRSDLRVQSRMGRMIGTPEYQSMTIRSWSTTTKLVDLLDSSA